MAENAQFALIHNGVVENQQALGGDCASDTGTIVKLLEAALSTLGSRTAAVRNVMCQLQGENSIVLLFAEGEIIGARDGPPLHLARSDDKYLLISDVAAISDWVNDVAYLDIGQIVRISTSGIKIDEDRRTINEADIVWEPVDHCSTTPHFTRPYALYAQRST